MDHHHHQSCPIMLITANVGSIYDDPNILLKSWTKQFLKTLDTYKPKFLALHMQEVGGKNYEESMKHVEDWLSSLLESEQLAEYDQVCIFLDEDFTCTEKFTALGSLYFIHNSMKCFIWNFSEHSFFQTNGRELYSGDIEDVPFKEKAKFPQKFFPECKWSRKGFMRTRWNINGTVIDLVNIHLFHDASNFIAMESFPSSYTKTRQHALEYTLNRFQEDSYENVPLFIFGDFNFRLDTLSVIQKITENSTPIHIKSAKNGEIEKILYKNPKVENKLLLSLEQKVFDLENHEATFFNTENVKWLLKFDKELDSFRDRLFEFDITFPPSYPFKEDSSGFMYMKTRCPGWCDRILLNKAAKSLIHLNNESPEVIYDMMGSTAPMGDHKPVFLWFNLGSHSERELEEMTKESGHLKQGKKCNESLTDGENKSSENEVTVSTEATRYICLQHGNTTVTTMFKETAV